MPRPKNKRRIFLNPEATYFKPAGIPMRVLEEIQLGIDELEAIRLAYCLGLTQSEAAKRMNISQPTFHRVLESGLRKSANALVNGKAIRIEKPKQHVKTKTRLK